ncbi:MAG: right-handed parallel beta-helix repeat-containing protein [Clostridiales bacterium]|nr:right-handed parallel beta-helix repeat-containing protein [Clostridiales bacterium]
MYSLLVMTISGSILALLLVGLRYTVLKKMPSTVYYYAWLLVLLRFALPLPGLIPTAADKANDTPVPSTPAVYSEMNAQENVHDTVQYNVPVNAQDDIQLNTQENIQNVSGFDRSDAAVSDTTASNIAPVVTETQETAVSEAAPKASFSIDWRSPALWLSVWGLGAFVSMGITVFSYLHFNFKLKKKLMEPDSFTKSVYASIPGRKPALYFSDSARTPMMLGVIRPKIVLPRRDYNEELLLNILRHELTHYRRFDTLYKWGASAILAMHWFNPLAWFIRREVNRSCELSCDEMLLRSMDRDEKQSYGNSLLLMAAQSPLPSAVVATSFATEKRNLKERLVQIMNYKKSGTRLLSTILAVALLTGCGIAAGPVSEKTSETADDTTYAGGGTVHVETVDEFLSAIAPNTVIELAEGVYDLSTASDYGKNTKSSYYSWNLEGVDDGNDVDAELIIHSVKDLTIRGAGKDKTTIVAVPRYADVIEFSGCEKISISNLTAGHTNGSDYCTGGVLLMENCNDVNVDTCGLYGCGTIGVTGISTENINVTNCDIYECSVGAIRAYGCEDFLVADCDIHDIGVKGEYDGYILFDVLYGKGATVYNCKIHDNKAEGLLYNAETEDVVFLSNEVTKNTFSESVFNFEQCGATVDGCCFEDINCTYWYPMDTQFKATDSNGHVIEADQFTSMELRDIDPDTVVTSSGAGAVPTLPAKDVPAGTEVTVTTVDEFLEAIGPDRTIVLDGTDFDLSTAENYGSLGTQYYTWDMTPDGPQLIIHDVDNLTIKAKDPDPAATTLEALPRYATVLTFKTCTNVTVSGFMAGHIKEKGLCAGGVLYFDECEKVKVEKMRLYGCGDMGIDAFLTDDIEVINTEIYECTSGGVFFTWCNGVNFQDNNIHHVPSPALYFSGCTDVTWNGQKLAGDEIRYDVKDDATLTPV